MTRQGEAAAADIAVAPEGRPRWAGAARNLLRDTIAGLIAAVVLIGNIVSFGALMFPGDLAAGMPTAIWAMLIGSCIAGVWIAARTSLPPLAVGIDSPTGAVLVVLSISIGPSVIAAGGSAQTAVATIMLTFTAATVMSGLVLFGLGALQWGAYLRFVPYFVVGGLLLATGWFLVAGGLRMTAGRRLAIDSLIEPWSIIEAAKLGSALIALAVLLAVRRFVKSPLAMPATLLLSWLTGVVALQVLGLSDPAHGWYFPWFGDVTAWSPFAAVRSTTFTWREFTALVPELIAVTIVSLASLVTKVSSIEVARQASADLDRELRGHGIGSLLAAPIGGIAASLQTGTSRLLEQAGGATRMSGAICALAMGAVALTNFNLPGVVPIAVVAALVFYLGWTFIVDALWRPLMQRAWLDVLLCLGIMIVCIRYGYLMGVLIGVICASLLFAISYARVGVVRRHVTRAQFASHVSRSVEASDHLRTAGDAIQLYWLSGYIFFGSSEGVFERIRRDIEARPPGRVATVILDFATVSGADTSAIVSLTKLRDYCTRHGITLLCCSLAPAAHHALKLGGFFGATGPHRAFADLNHALAWSEDELLTKAGLDADPGLAGFEPWLQHQLGPQTAAAELLAYFDRKDVAGAEILYREGDRADTVDLVAAGNLVIDIALAGGESLRVRRVTTHTVVGEMGFFRQSVRSATVSSDGPATLFTLTRAGFERMRRERPDLASTFDDFILRILADRIEFANRTVAALTQ